ncbi:hypothetical protein V1517DRAFT_330128 [Lipomyces orientalis]|uniref:Uncharacterized protein n=1 Tax=Lipomyces orientalis TaxID=1233043 RepID=A0ACC3TH13_9ASCO
MMVRQQNMTIARMIPAQKPQRHMTSRQFRVFSTSGRMFSRRIGNNDGPTLAHFIQAAATRRLWRTTLRTINELGEPELRKDMRIWAREEFDRHKTERDLERIKYFIAAGKKQLEVMAETLRRSRLS